MKPFSPFKLTKTSYLLGLQCPLRLWRHARGVPEAPPDEIPYDAAEDFAEEAQRVEELARKLLGTEAPYQVLLETSDCRTVTDFLIPEGSAHRLIEVKASSSVKTLHFRDLAFQWVVAEASGKPIHAAELIYVDKNYRRGPEGIRPEEVLTRQDVTEEVRAFLDQTRTDIQRLLPLLRADQAPVEAPGARCKANRGSKTEVRPSACGHLLPGALCRVELPDDWANELNDLRGGARATVDELPAPGRIAALDASAGCWTDAQRRLIRVSQMNAEIIEPEGLAQALAPFHGESVAFMDFEFDPFAAIPRFEGMKPFQRLPFQWALQRLDLAKQPYAYLHDAPSDPRRAFIESLLAALPASGPIVVYHAPAETTVLNYYLEDWFDGEYAEAVNGVLERIRDLLVLVKRHYAHPTLRGSFSLKRVAPAMLGCGYEDLAVSDGMAAVRNWRRLSSGQLPPAEARVLRQGLLDYCGRDALLMDGILRHLESAA